MRVLFSVMPGPGHMFPTIPLAWALRAAGHDVLFATAADGVRAAVAAGLPAVETAPGLNPAAVFGQGQGTGAELARRLRETGAEIARADGRDLDFVLQMFAKVSDAMADETLRVARSWQPDVVVYTRLQGAGLLAASALGVPAVEHGFDLIRQDGFAARYRPFLAATAARLGVPERLPEIEVVHVAPPEFLAGEGRGSFVRYVPYNAGGVLPDWLLQPADRPRVAVTLGTAVPSMAGVGSLAPLLKAAAEIDAEFILALGEKVDTDALGPLPANARRVGWVPLYQLLARCAAIVQHGGSTSTLTSLAVGVPQLVLPHAAQQFVNAQLVATRGLGLRSEPGDVSPEMLAQLLGEDRLRATAQAAAAQMRVLPPPAVQVPWIEELAGRARATSRPAQPGHL